MIDEASRKYREEAYNNLQSETQADNVGVAASYALHMNIDTLESEFDDLGDVLSKSEIKSFYSKIGQIKEGKGNLFTRGKFNEYVFFINNKMVYNNGKFGKPLVSKVVTIEVKENEFEDTIVDAIRKDLLEYDNKEYSGRKYEEFINSWKSYYEKALGRPVNITVDYGRNNYANRIYELERKEAESGSTIGDSQNITNGRGNTTEGFSTVKPSFALETSPEETKDLVAMHNLHETEITETLKLGGFAMPSIAIMKKDQAAGNSGYGEISVVFGKDTIDPLNNVDNKVYSGDAWTPRFPRINRHAATGSGELYSKMIDLTRKGGAMMLNSVDFHPDNLDDKLTEVGKIRNEKLKSKITLKEEAFIQELIKGKSQREAYKTAFSCKNWKPESIDARASHLFNSDKVQARYKEAYAEVVAAVRKDTILNQEQVMQELSCIARQQITDYLSWDDKHINVKPSDLVDSRAIKSVTYDKNGKLVLEFYDKQKALEKLLDIYDKADQTNDNDITINIGAAAEYAE